MAISQHSSPDLFDKTQHRLAHDVAEFHAEGRAIYLTSSFQTQSIPLLHMAGEVLKLRIEVVLIDTGFLFPETYLFVQSISKRFGLQVKKVRSKRTFAEQLTRDGHFLFASDLEGCCQLNKVEPMAELLSAGDVWISGIRADQSTVRSTKQRREIDDQAVVRYHPMLEWTARDVYRYIQLHDLPKHPLEPQGFVSIGCVPCTRKWSLADADSRDGRWEGSAKTECGLHLT